MPELIRPPALPSGATLGIIATSSPITGGGDALIERGFGRLRDKGFDGVEAPNCRGKYGHAAGTIEWYEHEDKEMVERPAPGWRCYPPGEATGPIVGGNLGTLLLLAETSYWPDMDGLILFVEEDEDDSPATIDRDDPRRRAGGLRLSGDARRGLRTY